MCLYVRGPTVWERAVVHFQNAHYFFQTFFIPQAFLGFSPRSKYVIQYFPDIFFVCQISQIVAERLPTSSFVQIYKKNQKFGNSGKSTPENEGQHRPPKRKTLTKYFTAGLPGNEKVGSGYYVVRSVEHNLSPISSLPAWARNSGYLWQGA